MKLFNRKMTGVIAGAIIALNAFSTSYAQELKQIPTQKQLTVEDLGHLEKCNENIAAYAKKICNPELYEEMISKLDKAHKALLDYRNILESPQGEGQSGEELYEHMTSYYDNVMTASRDYEKTISSFNFKQMLSFLENETNTLSKINETLDDERKKNENERKLSEVRKKLELLKSIEVEYSQIFESRGFLIDPKILPDTAFTLRINRVGDRNDDKAVDFSSFIQRIDIIIEKIEAHKVFLNSIIQKLGK